MLVLTANALLEMRVFHGEYGLQQPTDAITIATGITPITAGSNDPVGGVALRVSPSSTVASVQFVAGFFGYGEMALIPTFGSQTPPFSGGGSVNWDHNDVLVAAEPGGDFEDSESILWTLTDDPANSRVKISAETVTGGGKFIGVNAQGLNFGTVATPNWFSGTLSTTSGSSAVTGVGTRFLTEVARCLTGPYILHIQGAGDFAVAAIADDTHLTLVGTAGVTGAAPVYTVDFKVAASTRTPIMYEGANLFDSNNFHFTDSKACTGTVTKTAASTAIVGAGTLFTTELAVNQAISVPGGGSTDVLLIQSITDDTHLTVWPNNLPANSAGGQTATKEPSVIGIPAGLTGYYIISAVDDWRGVAANVVESNLAINDYTASPNIRADTYTKPTSASTASTETAFSTISPPVFLSAGDIVRNIAWQDSAGVGLITPLYTLGIHLIGTTT